MHRFDLTLEEDLIEEVVRLIGYNQLPATPPIAPVVPLVRSESQRSRFALRHSLAALGYQETINFSFVQERWELELAGNADPIRLLNPIASQMSVMRSSLLGSLLQVLKHNLDRKVDRLRVFELGRVFRRDAAVAASDTAVQGIAQPMHLAGLAYGPVSATQWGEKSRLVDFFDAKGDVQALLSRPGLQFAKVEHPAFHPGRCAAILNGGVQIGVVGELHPRWRQAYELPLAPVLVEIDAQAAMSARLPQAQALPRQLPVQRDLALIVADTVTHDQVILAAQGPNQSAGQTGTSLLKQVLLFDVFKPAQPVAGMAAGEKSLAVRLVLGDDEQTLTDAQIDAEVQAVIGRMQSQVAARLRA
jgi:phenylalanyl-tRNA synthetase beta chain